MWKRTTRRVRGVLEGLLPPRAALRRFRRSKSCTTRRRLCPRVRHANWPQCDKVLETFALQCRDTTVGIAPNSVRLRSLLALEGIRVLAVHFDGILPSRAFEKSSVRE